MPKKIPPIHKSVEAQPHSPVYRMHRYFARRPPSVFAKLVEHYTDEGDLVLDPFFGGGVTLVESVRRNRRAVGFDINPLATFITRMELDVVDLQDFRHAVDDVIARFSATNNRLFSTTCRKCGSAVTASWFEQSALAECANCGCVFSIAQATKHRIATWRCPDCGGDVYFAPQSLSKFVINAVHYHCRNCGVTEIVQPTKSDQDYCELLERELLNSESEGLWVPVSEIPDCNMQRESSLFKKGINRFRQMFTSRHLLALGNLHRLICDDHSRSRDMLLFAFSSTLRYTNRMVTRNPGWRGDKPLEWAKPGFWLPPVHLEANVLQQFNGRCDAILRGKRDYQSGLMGGRPVRCETAHEILNHRGCAYFVKTLSASNMPLPNKSVDAIITDPPYGSYVHYADLSNFWSVWLPEIEGLGKPIDSTEEAVIARKKFPGAKGAEEYQRLLESCFRECERVLKDDGYMVLTFNNREPRAWAALLVAATRAGFMLPSDGMLYQDGVAAYRHTAQSRRKGSVVGDFILTFRKAISLEEGDSVKDSGTMSEDEVIGFMHGILQRSGPLAPDSLMERLYIELQPVMIRKVQAAVSDSEEAVARLMADIDRIRILDSHRKRLLTQHFRYEDGKWAIGGAE